MSLIDKIINQNKIDAALLCESSDISYKLAIESAQQTRSKSDIINPGTIHFDQPKDEITKEMIIDCQKEQQDLKPVIDEYGEEMKYYPSQFRFNPHDIKQPNEINVDSLQRPAEHKDIVDGDEKNEKFTC